MRIVNRKEVSSATRSVTEWRSFLDTAASGRPKSSWHVPYPKNNVLQPRTGAHVEIVHKIHKFLLRGGILIRNVGECREAAPYACGEGVGCSRQFLEEGEHDISRGSPQPRAARQGRTERPLASNSAESRVHSDALYLKGRQTRQFKS